MSGRRLRVTGMGCTTCLGRGVPALLSGWTAARRGIAPIRRFDTARLAVHLGGEMPDPARHPGDLRGAAHLDEALHEALCAAALPSHARVRVVVATTKGFLESGAQVAERHPAHDVGLPARHVAARLAARLDTVVGATDVCTLSTACASGTMALAVAAANADAYAADGVDAVVVVGVDLLSDFVYRGFAALAAVDPGPCRPFDRRRAGMTPSEAVAVLILEPEVRAAARGAPGVGRLLGWGLADDATHKTAPDREGRGLARAAEMALGTAGVAPLDLGHVHAHGTGTVFNDAMEIAALRRVLGADLARVPLTTVKGNVGHAFGAAGLVETIASLAALRAGVLPGIAGLAEPEEGPDLVTTNRIPTNARVLKVGAGFGGFDAAVVLEAQLDG